jgi:hypothetical protein
MSQLFLACAVLGGCVLLLQLAATLLGVDADHADGELAEGLHLFSVRAIAGGVAFFGVAGRAALAAGMGTLGATAVGVGAGAAAALAVAWGMRQLRRLDSDGALQVERAIGQPGRVHVRIGGGASAGKVMVTVQERLVELPAVSLDGELPTGTPVTVVGVADGGTVEVVRTPDAGAPR